MSYVSEDISRLDGEIYENINGNIIFMSKVASLGTAVIWDNLPDQYNNYRPGWYPSYDIITDGGKIQVRLHNKWSDIWQKSCDDDNDHENKQLKIDLTGRVNEYRQQFLEIWKQWKQNTAHATQN